VIWLLDTRTEPVFPVDGVNAYFRPVRQAVTRTPDLPEEGPMSDNPDPPLLVSAEQLSHRLSDPAWVIVDCRFNLARPDAGYAAYRAGHIRSAVYAHLDRDLSAPRRPASGRHPLPPAADLVRLFSGWGVAPDTTVVAYDDSGGAIAARLWWLLRWMGHRHVGLLDGGFPAWRGLGLPESTELPPPRPAFFQGTAGHMAAVTTNELEQRLAAGRVTVVDVRAEARYSGRDEPIDPVAGHIPGAVNSPFQNSLTADGRFRNASALREIFAHHLTGRQIDDVVVMCGSGVTACHGLFAMELAGLEGASLYPGSWSEWIRAPSRRVATH
jgi:thiosulfate/3-mercaptopyruvate sulfurtransferase